MSLIMQVSYWELTLIRDLKCYNSINQFVILFCGLLENQYIGKMNLVNFDYDFQGEETKTN